MNDPMLELGAIGLALLVILLLAFLALRRSVVFIPNDSYGIVERKWGSGPSGPHAPIALGKEAGFLPDVLSGGWHVLMPFKYMVHRRRRITIDGIAYIVARVGSPLAEGQTLGRWPDGVKLEDARGFLTQEGQRGPQRRIIRSGTYAPNLALFCIITERAIHSLALGSSEDDEQLQATLGGRRGFDPVVIRDDTIGIVTVQDGPSLQHGEIVAPTVGTDQTKPETFHNSFQDIPRFLAAGGRRGRQDQVLVDGTYYLNAMFATIETIPKTRVSIGFVAVVNSYVGQENPEVLTADNGRGRTVPVGSKGIWERPYEPGKYPLNTYAMEVEIVPTTNFQLKWIGGISSGNGSFDGDLREIPVITADAFEVLLPISIVAHISPMNAPKVIQRFSNIPRLVGQTLDPLVSAYFKDATQSKSLLEFIRERQDIQTAALGEMRLRLGEHGIDIQEVLLGTPKPPPGDERMERMLGQLRDRQIAREQRATYIVQGEAAMEQRNLSRVQAEAEQQPDVTRSQLSITISENQGKAEVARKRELAEAITLTAEAEAKAARARADAIGGPEMLLRQLAIEAMIRMAIEGTMPVVPNVLVEGAAGEGGGLLGAMLAAAGASQRAVAAGPRA